MSFADGLRLRKAGTNPVLTASVASPVINVTTCTRPTIVNHTDNIHSHCNHRTYYYIRKTVIYY